MLIEMGLSAELVESKSLSVKFASVCLCLSRGLPHFEVPIFEVRILSEYITRNVFLISLLLP
jgi:hypothetical protein